MVVLEDSKMTTENKLIHLLAISYCLLMDDDWKEGKNFYLKRATEFYEDVLADAIEEAYDDGYASGRSE